MSKIYEALLRAEQERLAAGPDHARSEFSAQHPSGPDQDPFTSSPAPAAGPADSPFPDGSHQEHWNRAGEELRKDLQGLRLDDIRRSVWTPALDKLPALEQRGSGVEQFRRLRSRLIELRDLNQLKSVMVGSGVSSEGKSFIASNLAVALARHKASRVLMIDGDMRRGSMHSIFGCSQGPGLSEYLSGSADLNEVLQAPATEGRSLPGGLASLTVIASGKQGDRAAELSGHPRFRELLLAAAPVFEWIIVDSSPVNLVSDGVNLAHACDAVLLVARGGVTKIDTAQNALRELKATKIVGVVLNAVESSKSGVGYGGYSSYVSTNEQAGA